MKFLRFLGELAFFRWLFGSDESVGAPTKPTAPFGNNVDPRQSVDLFHEEQDDYDMFFDDF